MPVDLINPSLIAGLLTGIILGLWLHRRAVQQVAVLVIGSVVVYLLLTTGPESIVSIVDDFVEGIQLRFSFWLGVAIGALSILVTRQA